MNLVNYTGSIMADVDETSYEVGVVVGDAYM